jgi:hypothetical protein
MSCDQIQELLSRFHDGEVTRSERARVEIHLGTCPECAGELAAIAEVSEMIHVADEPPASANLWQSVARVLEHRRRLPSRWFVGGFARLGVAAVLCLAAVGGAWLLFRARSPVEHTGTVVADAVVDLGPFLDGLAGKEPKPAMSLRDAARQVSFRVVDSTNLPDGYCLEGCCVCRCGCCNLLECKYKRGAERLVLVQSSEAEPVHYGDRPVLETRVHGKPARIVQCKGRLAVSWETHGTVLHLMGPHDLSELVHLMDYVDQHVDKSR